MSQAPRNGQTKIETALPDLADALRKFRWSRIAPLEDRLMRMSALDRHHLLRPSTRLGRTSLDLEPHDK